MPDRAHASVQMPDPQYREVHAYPLVLEDRWSPLGRRSTCLDHVLRDAGLRDLEAELEQLTMDARRAPQRIVNAHPTDQRAQVCVDLLSTPRDWDFQRPYRPKPPRCHRTRVSGRMMQQLRRLLLCRLDRHKSQARCSAG